MRVADPDLKDLERRMNGAIEVLKQEFAGLRTGRASIHLLEPINVEAYGAAMPMNQVGTIGVPEPRMITVQVWDRSLVGAVERAIRESDLGLNPQTEGQLIRVPIPMLSEERRVELGKIPHKYAEQARIAVRHVRRDGMDTLKRMEREHELSQDEQHMWSDEIQEMTDRHIKSIDETLEKKDGEIMQV